MSIRTETYTPWGRTFEEYMTMFSLTDTDLSGKILGCSDGPSSFNSELTQRGGQIVSVDPLYELTPDQIRKLIDDTYPEAMRSFHYKKSLFIWKNLRNVHAMGRMRLDAMYEFLSDLEWGKMEGRYLAGNLPIIPLTDQEFDLAVCSHYLFTSTTHMTTQFHINSIAEMARVAKEVRVFPLLENGAVLSRHVLPTIAGLRDAGYRVRLEMVDYEFLPGGDRMLTVTSDPTN